MHLTYDNARSVFFEAFTRRVVFVQFKSEEDETVSESDSDSVLPDVTVDLANLDEDTKEELETNVVSYLFVFCHIYVREGFLGVQCTGYSL